MALCLLAHFTFCVFCVLLPNLAIFVVALATCTAIMKNGSILVVNEGSSSATLEQFLAGDMVAEAKAGEGDVYQLREEGFFGGELANLYPLKFYQRAHVDLHIHHDNGV